MRKGEGRLVPISSASSRREVNRPPVLAAEHTRGVPLPGGGKEKGRDLVEKGKELVRQEKKKEKTLRARKGTAPHRQVSGRARGREKEMGEDDGRLGFSRGRRCALERAAAGHRVFTRPKKKKRC